MAKKLIRLTEGDLHRIVKESVNNILNEKIEGQHYINLAKKGAADADAFAYWQKHADVYNDEFEMWLRMCYYNDRLSKEVRDAIKIVVDNYDSICNAKFNEVFNDAGAGKQPQKYYDNRRQDVVDPLEVPIKDRFDVRNGNWRKYNPLGYPKPIGYDYP